jgi:hypothetical protein
LLHQYRDKAENQDRRQETKLEILSAARKIVEVPVIFSPWTDCNQQSCEHNEDATTNGISLRGSVPERSRRSGCLLQSILSSFLNLPRSDDGVLRGKYLTSYREMPTAQ